VTSSVTWPFESQWVISYWWSIRPKSQSLTDSEILRPKHHVSIGTMLNRHCACAILRDMYPYVKFKYIFQFLAPTLPIHYATFIGLPWRIRGALSVTSNFKGQIERKFSKICQILAFQGAWRSGGMKCSDFTAKAYPCVKTRRLSHFAWMSVEGSDPQSREGKKSESLGLP